MDNNEFFRQATSRICGNLEIGDSLVSSLRFLKQKLPVDTMLLEFFEEGFGAMRTVAAADTKNGRVVDLLKPLSPKARQEMQRFEQEYLDTGQESAWLFSEDPHRNQLFDEILSALTIRATSLLVLPLRMTGRVIGGGGLILTTEGDQRFTPQHADLLYLLREPFSIAMSNALKHRELLNLKDMLADDNRYLHGELRHLSGDKVIGANFGLKDVMHKVRQVAALDSPVLLLGETGVGKDVIANAIHYSSSRSSGPFINVNCGAIPDSLIDSELFGHEKGAFTGALAKRRGRFERADKGTIFLDEIGELPLPAQVRLLRVLQDKAIERVGGAETISLDIRIIAATNRNLEERVKHQLFREDLWFRLNVFPVRIPPLRDRKQDIPALVQHFINAKAKELKLPAIPQLAPNAIEPLMEYHWPGNIRELENVVERVLILNSAGPVRFERMTHDIPEGTQGDSAIPEEVDDLDLMIARHIRTVLKKADGRVSGADGAAARLGVNPSTLRNRMKKLGIQYGSKRNPYT